MRRGRQIDSAADRPIYRQLADIIRDEVRSGRLGPGQMLPGESRLQDEYDVSLNSVRGALGILRAEGLLVTVRGRGTRVRRQEEVLAVKVPPGADITARPCTEAEARRHGVREGTFVFVIEHPDGRIEIHPTAGRMLHTTGADDEGEDSADDGKA